MCVCVCVRERESMYVCVYLGAGLDVPDFDEVVIRASDDAFPVRRESGRAHGREVPLQRAHLSNALCEMMARSSLQSNRGKYS